MAGPARADRRSASLLRLVESPQATLSMLLLCNTAVNSGFAALLTWLALARYEATVARLQIELVVAVLSTVLVLFWGEILPKTLASRSPAFLALRLARPVSVLAAVMRPVTALLETVAAAMLPGAGRIRRPVFRATPQAVELAVDLSAQQGAIEPQESEMILDALETRETKVREIMTPRPDLVRVPASATAGQAAELILGSGFSRLPVYSETVDNMVGIVYVKDLLTEVAAGRLDQPVSRFMRPPFFVSETRPASDLLRELKERGEPLAIVLDEYGGTAGVVSLEDVVEEIVGEIVDEFDRPEDQAARVDGGYVFSSRLLLEDINDRYGFSFPVPEDIDTIGGLLYALAGRPPRLGESFRAAGQVLTVAELRGYRVLKVRVTPEPALPDGDRPVEPGEEVPPQ